MTKRIPIAIVPGVELVPKTDGIATVRVLDPKASAELSWDRFVRLKAASAAVENKRPGSILDAGGYDGALAFFLSGIAIDLIDPATTGGSVLDIPVAANSYDAVVAVDVLEHIEPSERQKAVAEFARVARKYVILNYPCQSSTAAQELLFKLTGNSLIREHVEWELPDSIWVTRELGAIGFSCTVTPHTSVGVWVGQYLAQSLNPEAAKDLNKYLIQHHASDSFSVPLYHLVTAEKK